MKTKVVSIVIGALLLSTVAVAQFGLPTIVWDPTVDVDVVNQTVQVINEVRTLTAQLVAVQNTYNQVVNNAKMVAGKGIWSYIMPPMTFQSASNSYGNTDGWISSLNSGLQAVNHYGTATLQALNPGGLYRVMSVGAQNTFATHYATMELNDGMANHAMTVTGQARSNMAAQQNAIARLQADTLSDDAAQNTEVGILNKVNSATLIHAQTLQGTNQLLAAMADQQTIELKVRHDQMVGEMNAAIAAQSAAAANTDSLWGNDAAAHAARLP